MSTAVDVVDGEVVEEHGAEIVPVQQVQVTLLGTDDPVEVIDKASRVADKLKDVLKRQGLTSRIGNKDHVNVEGWQTVGMMVGVTAKKEWVRPIAWPADEFLTEALRKARDRGMSFGYEASFYAQTLGGHVIGAAEAACKRTEARWLASDDYAIESMAQTRATSKALASVLRWIVTMAGYSGTPSEEMPPDGTTPAPQGKALPLADFKRLRELVEQSGCARHELGMQLLVLGVDNHEAVGDALVPGQISLAAAKKAAAMMNPEQGSALEQGLTKLIAGASDGR